MAQFGIIGLTCSFGAVVLSVVNHFYLNPLSKTEAGDWLHQHPTAIGETVLYMGESYYYFAFTIVIWCRFLAATAFLSSLLGCSFWSLQI